MSVKILVCVKQVPDSSDTLAIDDQTGLLVFKPSTVFRMNRYDEFALEEALVLKEKFPGTSVHALSFGPERVKSTVRRALEMGADHGIHMVNPAETLISPFTVASSIAEYARDRGYDLILTGVMAEDDMACQTGQLIAAILNLPCASSAICVDVRLADNALVVEREIESGRRLEVQLDMPAVLTIQSGINTPRYPSLSNVMRARTQQQEVIKVEADELPQERETFTNLRLADSSSQGTFLAGSPREKAGKLLQILHEWAVLR
jgi:electron transfer flavoprotein beta subunit